MKLRLCYKESIQEISIDENNTILNLFQIIETTYNISIKKQILIYESIQLKTNDTKIKDNNILDNSCIHISKKKSKKQCPFGNCENKITVQSQLLGYCRWCNKTFCCEHRMPETHNCENYEDCRKSSFDKNAKLVGEMKCIQSKV